MAASTVKGFNIPTRIHGRVLVREAKDAVAVLVGFHGYMEDAGIQMTRLEALPASERLTLVSVQGLNRFYRGRSEDVVAGWMTRQDREAIIEDNIEYCDRAVDLAAQPELPVFMAGFSQGVAMAFRAATRGRRRAIGVVAVGGDVPPELLRDAALTFPAVLLATGEDDDWYTSTKLEADATALRARHTTVETVVYRGGHEWTDDVSAAASSFLGRHLTA